MTVRELIRALEQFPNDLDVVVGITSVPPDQPENQARRQWLFDADVTSVERSQNSLVVINAKEQE